MNTTARRAIVALTTILLGGLVLATPAAAASTQGFQVLNLTGSTLKLISLSNEEDNPQLPRIPAGGILYAPGFEPDFQVSHTYTRHDVEAKFEKIDRTGKKTGDLTLVFVVDGYGYPYSRKPFSGGVKVEGDGNNGKYLRVYDYYKSTIDASSWTSREQAYLVGAMCRHNTDSDGGPVRCKGNITSQGPGDLAYANREVVDGPYGNSNCTPSKSLFSWNETKTITNSWAIEATVGAGSKDAWNTALTTKYGGSYVKSQEYSHSEEHQIQPGTRVAMIAQVPVIRHVGTYSIVAGPTEWTIKNVPVDTLDPKRKAGIDWEATPMNPNDKVAQKPSFCP